MLGFISVYRVGLIALVVYARDSERRRRGWSQREMSSRLRQSLRKKRDPRSWAALEEKSPIFLRYSRYVFVLLTTSIGGR